jgi:hypothetical protein
LALPHSVLDVAGLEIGMPGREGITHQPEDYCLLCAARERIFLKGARLVVLPNRLH